MTPVTGVITVFVCVIPRGLVATLKVDVLGFSKTMFSSGAQLIKYNVLQLAQSLIKVFFPFCLYDACDRCDYCFCVCDTA